MISRFQKNLLLAGLVALPVFGANFPALAQFEDSQPQIAVSVEFIGLEKATAFRLLEEHEAEQNAVNLREVVEKHLDAGKADLIESIYGRVSLGKRTQVESAEEFQYGTEGDPPEIPNEVDLRNVKTDDFRGTPGAFVAFETRNVGPALEFEADLRENLISVDLSVELVTRLFDDFFARHEKMHRNNEMQHKSLPRFATLKITNEYQLKTGETVLAGTLKPIRYREEKPAEAGEPEKDTKRVFVFLTAWVLD